MSQSRQILAKYTTDDNFITYDTETRAWAKIFLNTKPGDSPLIDGMLKLSGPVSAPGPNNATRDRRIELASLFYNHLTLSLPQHLRAHIQSRCQNEIPATQNFEMVAGHGDSCTLM